MKKIITIGLLFLGGFSLFSQEKTKETKINGGAAAGTAFPYYVVSGTQSRCGLSILSEKWAITAAHCITQPGVSNAITVGSKLWAGRFPNIADYADAQPVIVERIITHPDWQGVYAPKGDGKDLALIEITGVFDFSKPKIDSILPVFPDEAADVTKVGVGSFIAGYGVTATGSATSTYLKKAAMLIANSLASEDATYSIRADRYDGSGCSGDSGGPLIVSTVGGVRLAGVLSTGSDPCGSWNNFGRVSAHIGWISQVTGLYKGVPTGVDFSISEEQAEVFPNPMKDVITLPEYTSSVQVFDLLGTEVMSETVSSTSFNVETLSEGSYIFKIIDAYGQFSMVKMIKE